MQTIRNNQRSSELSHPEQLLEFCDEFTEFVDYSAFFCESISAMVDEKNLMDKESRQGLKRYAQFLKDRSRSLDLWLQQIQAISKQQQGCDSQSNQNISE